MSSIDEDFAAIHTLDGKFLLSEDALQEGMEVVVPDLLTGSRFKSRVEKNLSGMFFVQSENWLLSLAFRNGHWFVLSMGNKKLQSS